MEGLTGRCVDENMLPWAKESIQELKLENTGFTLSQWSLEACDSRTLDTLAGVINVDASLITMEDSREWKRDEHTYLVCVVW